MSPIDEKQQNEEQETVEEQRFSGLQKAPNDQTLALLAFLVGMLIGTIISFILTGNPTTDAPPPESDKKKKKKRK